jgi:hypothetical protein
MGLRISNNIDLIVGMDNALDDCLFSQAFQELLDTLEHGSSESGTLNAGETNRAISFGDVVLGRFVYVEAEGDIAVSFGGVAPIAATLSGAAGVFPTGFAGGETVSWNVDGTAIVTTFLAADQTVAQVVARMNASAALLGLPTPIAVVTLGQIVLTSPTTGSSSSLSVVDDANSIRIGLGGGISDTGSNSTPGTSALTLKRMADAASSQIATLKSYAMLTLETTAMYLTNLDAANPVRFRYCVAGDLTPASV